MYIHKERDSLSLQTGVQFMPNFNQNKFTSHDIEYIDILMK